MMTHQEPPRANKTDAGNGSKAICRVSNVLRSPSPDPRRSVKNLKIITWLLTVQIVFLVVWICSHWVSIYATSGIGNLVFVLSNQPDSTTLEVIHMDRVSEDGWIPYLHEFALSRHSSGPFFQPKPFSDTLSGAFTVDFTGGPTAKVSIPYWLISAIPAVVMLVFFVYSYNAAQNKPAMDKPDPVSS